MLRDNFGSSGELQKQIEAGALVDLFISAALRKMDELERQPLIAAPSRRGSADVVTAGDQLLASSSGSAAKAP